MSTLQVDDLVFAVRRSSRRKTVGITVERDASLVVSAPLDCSLARIETIVRERQFWVYCKLAEKDRLFRSARPKEFVSGENFFYLGRCHRLKIVEPHSQSTPLRLHHGRFLLRRDAVASGARHFAEWYSRNGHPWLARRVGVLAPRVMAHPTGMSVRDLGFRWGSCSSVGGLNFHWRTMLLPARIVEYVVAHELVHLLVPDHGSEFWVRLERVMPDYAARKQWLAEHGADYQ